MRVPTGILPGELARIVTSAPGSLVRGRLVASGGPCSRFRMLYEGTRPGLSGWTLAHCLGCFRAPGRVGSQRPESLEILLFVLVYGWYWCLLMLDWNI